MLKENAFVCEWTYSIKKRSIKSYMCECMCDVH